MAGAGVPEAAEVAPAELAVALLAAAVDCGDTVAILAVLFAVVGTVVPVKLAAWEFREDADRAPVVLPELPLPDACAEKIIPVGRGIWLTKASIVEGNSAVAS